jgi:hypothetical protein
VLIVPKKGAPFLARLVLETGAKLRVAQINPAGEKDISRKALRAAYAVVGRG